MDAPVLPYASGRARQRWRHFHVWLLPIVWLPGAWGSLVHYGDEFFAFGMANLPSVVVVYPLMKVLEHLGSTSSIGQRTFPVVVAIGFVLWAAIGWILDRLRAWRWVYGVIPIVPRDREVAGRGAGAYSADDGLLGTGMGVGRGIRRALLGGVRGGAGDAGWGDCGAVTAVVRQAGETGSSGALGALMSSAPLLPTDAITSSRTPNRPGR